eukprot:6184442-Pleurochrysis_carterae.AAC.2
MRSKAAECAQKRRNALSTGRFIRTRAHLNTHTRAHTRTPKHTSSDTYFHNRSSAPQPPPKSLPSVASLTAKECARKVEVGLSSELTFRSCSSDSRASCSRAASCRSRSLSSSCSFRRRSSSSNSAALCCARARARAHASRTKTKYA